MTRTSRRRFAQTIVVAGAALPLLGHKPAADAETKKREEQSALIERLRALELDNSDEPDFTFSALTRRW